MKNLIFLLIIALGLTSCFSLKITSNQDKEIDISNAKTFSYYGWIDVNDMVDVDQKRIEKALGAELLKRGLTHQEVGGDLAITLLAVVDKNSTKNRYGSFYANGPYGYYQPTWGWGVGYHNNYNVGGYAGEPYHENSYYKGTLVMDVFDKASKKLAWQGVLDKAIKPEKQNKTDINKLAARMMKKFPIEPLEK